jgi:hypothetical protein
MSVVAAAEPVGRNQADTSPVSTDGRMGKLLLVLASTVILYLSPTGLMTMRTAIQCNFPLSYRGANRKQSNMI